MATKNNITTSELVRRYVEQGLSVDGHKENVDFSREFVFLSKTNEEISLVCEAGFIPKNVIAYETGWKALKITGTLDFGMIGVISNRCICCH